MVGHGWRNRQAHDRQHSLIRVRRARCLRCGITITVLPAWAVPWAPYSLAARAQAVQHYVAEQMPLELCAPDTAEDARLTHPSTLRRWFQRRLASWWICLVQAPVLVPTIFAWDGVATARMLMLEATPP